MIAEEDERRPIFIFLDENNSSAGPEVHKYLLKQYAGELAGFDLNFSRFPKKNSGFKDWKVVLYLKEKITASCGKIAQSIRENKRPIFILLTLDTYFIKDAERGFNRFDEEWSVHEQQLKIFCQEKFIILKLKMSEWVDLRILSVTHSDTDSQRKINAKMGEALRLFLHQF